MYADIYIWAWFCGTRRRSLYALCCGAVDDLVCVSVAYVCRTCCVELDGRHLIAEVAFGSALKATVLTVTPDSMVGRVLGGNFTGGRV